MIASVLADRRALITVALALIALALAAGVTGTRYETNDDPLLNGLVAGRVITDTPDEHLVFTNVLVGLGLKQLYLAVPGVPWYGAYLLTLLSLTALAFVWLFASGPPAWRWSWPLLVAGFLIATMSVAVARLQFTRVAFLAAESGWLVIAAAALRARESRAWPPWVLGGSLVVLGTLVRAEAAVLASMLAIPALVMSTLLARSAGASSVKRFSVATVLVVAACGLSLGIDSRYYRADPAWREFLQYHWLRAEFIDAGRVTDEDAGLPQVKAVGWTEDDLWMMQAWFGLHPKVFSRENLEAVLAGSPRAWRLADTRTFTSWLDVVARSPAARLLLVLAVCAGWAAGWRLAGLSMAAACALVAAAASVLLANAHFPARMYEPAMSVPVATGLLIAAHGRRDEARSVTRQPIAAWILIALVVTLSVATVRDGAGYTQQRRADHAIVRQAIAQMAPSANQLYVVWGSTLAYESLIGPLDDLRALDDFKVLPLGWPNRSPVAARRLSQFGIDDLYVALWQRPDVLLLSTEHRCQRLAAFIEQHYRQSVACLSVNDALSVRRLAAVEVRGPRINVRWQPWVDEPTRRKLEERYGLANPRPDGDRTWRYEVTDPSPSRLLALLRDRATEDTHGIDRPSGRLSERTPGR